MYSSIHLLTYYKIGDIKTDVKGKKKSQSGSSTLYPDLGTWYSTSLGSQLCPWKPLIYAQPSSAGWQLFEFRDCLLFPDVLWCLGWCQSQWISSDMLLESELFPVRAIHLPPPLPASIPVQFSLFFSVDSSHQANSPGSP